MADEGYIITEDQICRYKIAVLENNFPEQIKIESAVFNRKAEGGQIPLPNSSDLLLIAHDEWKRREERKHQHDHISWVNGWISGFLTSRKFVRDMLIKLHSPRHGGESPAQKGCEGAVSEDSRKED